MMNSFMQECVYGGIYAYRYLCMEVKMYYVCVYMYVYMYAHMNVSGFI
jgi:hypothetical protein